MEHIQIISEIGINHGGSMNLAKKLVLASLQAGVDTVKLQTVNPDLVYKKSDPLYSIFKKTQFSKEQWIELKELVESYKMEFLSTPGDRESVDMLDSIGVKRFKIASDSAKDVDFVNYVMSKGKPVILSTGYFKNIGEIISFIHNYQCFPDVILHCVSKYPTPPEMADLYKITELKDYFYTNQFYKKYQNIKIGYSDHVQSYIACLTAVNKGAEVIEKHIKLDDKCVDANVSIEPDEFKRMVRLIREMEVLL